jgi:4-hydroxy-tetrahydrodipicolinate synthase
VAHTARRVPTLVGAIGCGTADVIAYAKKAERFGADGLVLINPYYAGMTEEAIFRHFATIMERVSIPAMVCNLPGSTGQSLSVRLVKRIAQEIPAIAGLKDTIDLVSHIREAIVEIKPVRPDFSILCGYDEHLLLTLLLGGDGCVPASANFAPHLTCGILKAYREADLKTAERLQRALSHVGPLYLSGPPFFGALKEAIRLSGVDVTTAVLPSSMAPDAATKTFVTDMMEKIRPENFQPSTRSGSACNKRRCAMDSCRQVPALQKTMTIIQAVANNDFLKASDICDTVACSKSHLYAILNMLCEYKWLQQNEDKSYCIGNTLVKYGTMRLYPLELIRLFLAELYQSRSAPDFTYQMSILENTEIIYLAKTKRGADGHIITYPGMRLPAHCTAMGKVLLSQFGREALDAMYPGGALEQLTANTVSSVDELWMQIEAFRHCGVMLEVGEVRSGYSCVAALVHNAFGRIAAAISMATLTPYPSEGRRQARELVKEICARISSMLGYAPETPDPEQHPTSSRQRYP